MDVRRSCTKILVYAAHDDKINSLEILGAKGKVTTTEYSHSADGVEWSEWTDHAGFLTTVSPFEMFRIRFVIDQRFRFDTVRINNMYTVEPIKIITKNSTASGKLIRNKNEGTFTIREAMQPAHDIRTDLVDVVTQRTNYKCTYYRVEGTEANATLKTFGGRNVYAEKELKITFKDGNKPTTRPTYSEYDFGHDAGFEIEISHVEFERVFGSGEHPNEGDFIRLEMDNNLYTITTVFEDRDLGTQAAWYNAFMTMWKDRQSTTTDEGVTDVSDFEMFVEDHRIEESIIEQKDATGYSDSLVKQDVYFDSSIVEQSSNVLVKTVNEKRFYETTDFVYTISVDSEKEEYAFHNCIIPSLENDTLVEGYTGSTLTSKLTIENGYLCYYMYDEIDTQRILCRGTKMESGTRYAISVNRIKSFVDSYIEMQVISNGEVLQKVFKQERGKFDSPTRMKYIYQNTLLGNVHYSETHIKSDEILSRITNDNSHSEYLFIDKVNQAVDAEKMNDSLL